MTVVFTYEKLFSRYTPSIDSNEVAYKHIVVIFISRISCGPFDRAKNNTKRHCETLHVKLGFFCQNTCVSCRRIALSSSADEND